MITVIIVVKDDLEGVKRTLASLASLIDQPAEVIVQVFDNDTLSASLLYSLAPSLKIKVFIEKDRGIYDAMNRARMHVQTPFIHYLNAGDEVSGTGYGSINNPGLLPLQVMEPCGLVSSSDVSLWKRFFKNVCHQQVIFSVDHEPYPVLFRVCADFYVFKVESLRFDMYKSLDCDLTAVFYKGGFSSSNKLRRRLELIIISVLIRVLL